jgi:hypothetical protein
LEEAQYLIGLESNVKEGPSRLVGDEVSEYLSMGAGLGDAVVGNCY